MQSVSLTDVQTLVVMAQPEDVSGNPAANFNPATWAVADNTVATVTGVSADGLSATLNGKKVGSTTVTVTGQQGNFLPTYTTSFSVTVNPDLPTKFNFVFGTPTP